MKKLFFAVAALLVSVSMSAQLWVGGSLGFDSKSYPGDGTKNQTWFEFSPMAGYALSDVLEVGAAIDLFKESNISGLEGNDYFYWEFTPFARYTFLTEEKLSLFLQGEIGLGQDKTGDADPIFGFSAGICPGIKIPLTENLSVVSTFGWLGFDSWNESNGLSLYLSSSLSFGLYYAF